MVRVHLDTDIGGDIDDLCALALLLAWPAVEIVGITTVNEVGGRLAGYACEVLRIAGREAAPVAAGADVTLGRFRDPPTVPDETRYWPRPVEPVPGPLAAALDLLKANIDAGAVVVAIGPFTNLALLEERHPGTLARANLTLMGGFVRPIRAGYPQWPNRYDYNIQQDVAASRLVIETARPLLVPATITVETAFRAAYLPGLRQAGPLGDLLARQGEAHAADNQTRERVGAVYPGPPDDILNFQHDPLAVAVALGWDGVTIETLPLRLRVEDGWLVEQEEPGGLPIRVVTSVDGPRFNAFWYERVTSAGRPRLHPWQLP
jgi:inosine-uridine nucleoside N-ribohydrolase